MKKLKNIPSSPVYSLNFQIPIDIYIFQSVDIRLHVPKYVCIGGSTFHIKIYVHIEYLHAYMSDLKTSTDSGGLRIGVPGGGIR